jgi:hypothetical protein
MKKTILSIAAASLVATSAMAADKGIDFTTTGQAVVYYNTLTTDSEKLFDRSAAKANVGFQFNLNADLKNGFGFGSQFTYLDAYGLNKNLVGDTNVMQVGGSVPSTQALGGTKTTDDLALTKIYLTKKVANTTVKIGRQELPKSLSPLAFSEGWNVFKNTYEAIVVVNTDLPKTTLVGAYVGGSNPTGNLSAMQDLKVNGALDVNGPAYMVTAVNTSLPMTTLTASYYALKNITTAKSANAVWLDAKIAGKAMPAGLKVGVQAGSIMPEASGLDDTSAFGVKATLKPIKPLTVCAAYTHVNDGTAHVVNTGTGVKTPLYTQMVANQANIKTDNDTVMLKGVYSLGKAGTVIAQGSYSVDNSAASNDMTDVEMLYKTKVSGINLLLAGVLKKPESGDSTKIVRVVARYNF